jgi:uncharacterized membrane protein
MWTELPIAPLLVLLTLCLAGYWFVVRMRDFSKNDRKTTADHKKKFEEMLRRGDISDKEFRNIESVLGGSEPPGENASPGN